jgi:hypothetical protein
MEAAAAAAASTRMPAMVGSVAEAAEAAPPTTILVKVGRVASAAAVDMAIQLAQVDYLAATGRDTPAAVALAWAVRSSTTMAH